MRDQKFCLKCNNYEDNCVCSKDPELAKQAATKREEEKKNKPKPKEKRYYDIKIEAMVPTTLTFRVLAEDAQQAVEMIRGKSPTGIKHRINEKRDIKLTVLEAGSNMIKLILNHWNK